MSKRALAEAAQDTISPISNTFRVKRLFYPGPVSSDVCTYLACTFYFNIALSYMLQSFVTIFKDIAIAPSVFFAQRPFSLCVRSYMFVLICSFLCVRSYVLGVMCSELCVLCYVLLSLQRYGVLSGAPNYPPTLSNTNQPDLLFQFVRKSRKERSSS